MSDLFLEGVFLGGGAPLDLVLLDVLGLAVDQLDLPLGCHAVVFHGNVVDLGQELLMGRWGYDVICGAMWFR